MNIELTIRFANDLIVRDSDARLKAIEGALTTLTNQGVRLMATTEDVKAAVAAIDAATNAIAARLDALTAQIGTGMSQADVDAVASGLQAEVARLQGLGADPENPTPA